MADNEALVKQIQEGSPQLLYELWQQNTGLIDKIVKKYTGIEDREDLTQEAYIGFMRAVQGYDSNVGVLFSTYVYKVISTHLRGYIYNCCHTIKVPEVVAVRIWKYKKYVEEYRKNNGRTPTDPEVCQGLDIDPEELENLKAYDVVGNPTTLDERIPGEEEEGDTLAERYRDNGIDVEAQVIGELDYNNMCVDLWEAVDNLPEREGQAIRLKYKEEQTDKVIGQALGVSHNRARQLHMAGARRLRRNKKIKNYKECYLNANSIQHVGVAQFQRTWTSEVERTALRRI